MILDINVGAIIYARTPDRIRARAGGAFRFINYGVRPIGALLGGLLGTAIGVREAILFDDDRGASAASCSWSARRSCGCATCRRRPSRASAAPGHSQRKVRAASTTAHDAPDREDRRASRPRSRRRPPRAPPGTRRRGPRPAARPRSSRAAPGRCATGRTIPPSSRNAMNRPLARARVASARSAPASSRPSPANASVPSRRLDDEERPATRPARGSSRGRRPRSRRAGRPARSRRRGRRRILAASRPPRVSGEPPSRLRTP